MSASQTTVTASRSAVSADELDWLPLERSESWFVAYHGTRHGMASCGLSILEEHTTRTDELVDRYRNNTHFMHLQGQLMRDLILRISTSSHSQAAMLDTFAACSSKYDYGDRRHIDHFCLNYEPTSVLKFYRQSSFFHKELNRILRQKNLDEFYLIRHVINDLIGVLRQPVSSEEDSVSLTLYRGQQMHIFELNKLKNNVGEIVAIATFFSTTMNPKVAETFAGDASRFDRYLVSVIFKIYLDTSQETRPYALIANSGDEEEVLLSPGTSFMLMSCRKLDDNSRLWLIELQAITERQQEQVELTYGEALLLLSSASGWPLRS